VELAGLLGELGFQKVLNEVLAEGGGGVGARGAGKAGGEGPGGEGAEGVELTVIEDPDGLAGLVRSIRAAGRASICLNLTDEGVAGELIGVSVSTGPDKVFYVATGKDGAVSALGLYKALKDVLEDGRVIKDTDNSKALILHAKKHGISPKGMGIDTALAAYLLDPSRPGYSAEKLAYEYLGIVAGSAGGKGDLPVLEAQTLAEKATIILELAEILEKRLKEEDFMNLYSTMELPLAGVLADMEFLGIKVDCERLAGLSKEMELKLTGLEGAIYRSAGVEFNINSPKQLSGILFEKLGLRPVKKTKTGFSTDEEVLRRLAREHEIPEMILSFRQLVKLKSTYVDAILGLVNPETGRVHTSFNQTVTATGRLSSSRPNLQNIPVRGEMAARIREAFVSEEGFKLLSADYSQIELRLVAHMSGDPVLIDAFEKEEDIHTRTASEIFSVPPEEVTPELRRRAKAINFGSWTGP
jgi:DNA polymerase-1